MRVILQRGSRRIHLLTGACFSGVILAITYVALTEPSPYPFEPDPNLSLALPALIPGIVLAVGARLERFWVPIVMAPFGILAAQASAVYSVSSVPGDVAICAVTHFSSGFPLQYYFTMGLIGPRCAGLPLPFFIPPRMLMMPFLLDAVFYVAVGVAIIQLCRGITGKASTARSPPVNNTR